MSGLILLKFQQNSFNMSICLTFGKLELTGEQLYNAIAHYGLLSTLLEQLFLDFQVLPNIEVTGADLFELLSGRDRASMPDPEALEQFLSERAQQYEMSIDQLKSKAMREIRMQKLKQQFAPQIESEFLRSRSNYDQVEFSLVQTSDANFAAEVLFQIRDDGKDFGEIAQRHSEGSERSTKGWVGPMKLANLPEPIRVLFCTGEVGKIYGPIEINGQYCIVRLERFHGARLTEVLRAELINSLFARWLSEQTGRARQAEIAQINVGDS